MLASNLPEFDIYNPNMPVYTNARMLPPAKIHNSQIVDSLIAEASVVVNSHIERSVIGIRSFVGNNVRISRSVLMGADYYPWQAKHSHQNHIVGPPRPGIDEGTIIKAPIIDRTARTGKCCRIRIAPTCRRGRVRTSTFVTAWSSFPKTHPFLTIPRFDRRLKKAVNLPKCGVVLIVASDIIGSATSRAQKFAFA